MRLTERESVSEKEVEESKAGTEAPVRVAGHRARLARVRARVAQNAIQDM